MKAEESWWWQKGWLWAGLFAGVVFAGIAAVAATLLGWPVPAARWMALCAFPIGASIEWFNVGVRSAATVAGIVGLAGVGLFVSGDIYRHGATDLSGKGTPPIQGSPSNFSAETGAPATPRPTGSAMRGDLRGTGATPSTGGPSIDRLPTPASITIRPDAASAPGSAAPAGVIEVTNPNDFSVTVWSESALGRELLGEIDAHGVREFLLGAEWEGEVTLVTDRTEPLAVPLDAAPVTRATLPRAEADTLEEDP